MTARLAAANATRQTLSDEKWARIQDHAAAMLERSGHINLSRLARDTAVSPGFLKTPSRRAALAQMTEDHRQRESRALATGNAITAGPLRVENANLKAQVTRLTDQLRKAEKRLGKVLGREVVAEWEPDERLVAGDVDAMREELSTLREQVVELEDQLQDRDERLTELRRKYRELLKQANMGTEPNR